MAATRPDKSTVFSSNAIRLSLRELMFLGAASLVLALSASSIWMKLEEFDPGTDFRMPYRLSDDYWLFDRYCGSAAQREKTPVFGDSFVWGQYVPKEQTLTHHLNREAGTNRFANAGLDGGHPLALEGLLKYHCAGIRGRPVVLHLNLLWLNSPQADLQVEGDFDFNHPRLVPQITPRIPSYGGTVSERIGIILSRHVPTFDWVRHLQSAYFQDTDLSQWTLENPYSNPLRQLTLDVSESNDDRHPDAQPWFVQGRGEQRLSWVPPDSSLQWRAFQRTVMDLRDRSSRVLVVVGPLNEHMLESESRSEYRGILRDVEGWLQRNRVEYVVPSLLPSELYADLSHPLDEGYALLAEEIWETLLVGTLDDGPTNPTLLNPNRRRLASAR